MMADISNPHIIILKGFLFLLCGMLAATAILIELPSLKIAFLLFILVWCAARLYYFMFYVIEKYVDTSFRFSGIGACMVYLFRRYWKR
jgi:hypothetical protein